MKAAQASLEKLNPLCLHKGQMGEIEDNLKKTVRILAKDIGSRGYRELDSLEKTAQYISSELRSCGYDVSVQSYNVEGNVYKNLIAEIKGIKSPEKIILVGAHYDTVTGSPGADDNASGVAGMLELARLLKNQSFDKTVRFAAFTLEEPPFFRSRFMGSYVYAQSLNEKNTVIEGMICLEMIGYFTDSPNSQYFPFSFLRWLYPDKGSFIIFVSNLRSKNFLIRLRDAFKKGTDLPAESISTLSIVPGIDFSDHRSFWEFGYDAVMVTDTAFYRNPNYHERGDVPETLDYERMEKVVMGIKTAIEKLAGLQQ
ncbi:MAG: M28 family peptidase [Nitrospirae bacterium]|nr:M28 family peptidase [Nitrospirota bacterium]